MELIDEWKNFWKAKKLFMIWMDSIALSFKSPAFKKKSKDSKGKEDLGSSKKRKIEETDGLSEELRNCYRKMITIDCYNKPIEPSQIEFRDLVVIKCHLRY